MKLQNILFPSIETCAEEEMFFRHDTSKKSQYYNDRLILRQNEHYYFDTYFNSFSIEKWHKYTFTDQISLTLFLKGDVRVVLMRKEKTNNGIQIELLSEEICSSETVSEYSFTFKSASYNGIYCFSLCGEDDEDSEAEFYGGYYSGELTDTPRDIKIAIDICTYKREKFVEKNIKLLKNTFLENARSELKDHLEIFISDNGGSLPVKALQSDKIHIFDNKNTGGAGGFTRGLIEINRIKRKNNITHALLMDDDIIIEPESVFRTYALLSCLKNEYSDAFIGGAMLRLDYRNIQVESGAVWAGGNIISLKAGLDLIDCDNVLFNEMEEYAEFNAWWYCVLPVNIISDTNLPMPIFIRGDDVEFGLRNMKRLVLMNGICVWHEPFENKYSSFLFYYIIRNRLIDNSLHDMVIPIGEFLVMFKRQVTEQIRLYRYKNANLIMDGVEDFLRGVKWLEEQDGEALHKSVMSRGYKLSEIEKITDDTVSFSYFRYYDSVSVQNPTTLKYRFLRKVTTNGIFFIPSQRKRLFNVVPAEGAKDINVYRTDKVLNYDYSSRKGFITYKDPKEARKTVKRMKKMLGRIKSRYMSASRDYKENGKRLMNIEFWNRYLQINGDKEISR